MELQKFGKLTVINQKEKNKRGERTWLCQCECGNFKIVKEPNLKNGTTKSCGCIKTGPKRKELIGLKFNRLLVLENIGRSKCRSQKLKCKCDCGKIVTVLSSSLKTNRTKSCGCFVKELMSSRKGIFSPTYNHNLSDEERFANQENRRIIEGYAQWRKEVKKKANFLCKCCGKNPSGKLVSHHLDGFHWKKESRLDINNGVCLCRKCHTSFHKKFGYKNNTKEQFEQFLIWKNEQFSNDRKNRRPDSP